jgi:hypothetical protein
MDVYAEWEGIYVAIEATPGRFEVKSIHPQSHEDFTLLERDHILPGWVLTINVDNYWS